MTRNQICSAFTAVLLVACAHVDASLVYDDRCDGSSLDCSNVEVLFDASAFETCALVILHVVSGKHIDELHIETEICEKRNVQKSIP